MNKKNIYKFIYILSALCMVGFCIRIVADYLTYDPISNSAPFYAFMLVRMIEFIIPSIVFFIIGKVIKKKYNK